MIASLSQGAPWLFAALLIWASVIWLMLKNHAYDEEGLVQWLMGMDLHQMLTLKALLTFAPALLILGLALWSMP